MLTSVITLAVALAAPHVALAGCVVVATDAAWRTLETLRNGAIGVTSAGGGKGARGRAALAGQRALVLVFVAVAALGAGRYHAASFDAVVRLFAPFGSTAVEEGEGSRLAPEGASVKREVRLSDLVRPPAAPPKLARGVVHTGYLGLPLLFFAGVGAIRRRTLLNPDAPPARTWGPFVVGAASLALALGSPGPYDLLAAASDTIAQSNTPYRFLIGAIVGFSASLALLPWRAWMALVLLPGLWGLAWVGDPRALPLTPQHVEHDPSSVALRGGTGEVLDLPVSGPQCREGATHFLLEGTVHRRPLPVVLRPGYDAYVTPDAMARARLINDELAACTEAAVAAVRTFGTVVAHGHRACNLGPREASCLRRHFGPGTSAGKVTWWEIPPG